LPVAYDEDTGFFLLENGNIGFILKAIPLPLVGLDLIERFYKNLFKDINIPEGAIFQFNLVASERIDPLFWAYKKVRFKEQQRIKDKLSKLLVQGDKLADIYKKFTVSNDLIKALDFFTVWAENKKFESIVPGWSSTLRDFYLYIAVIFPTEDITVLENPKKKEYFWKLKERIKTSLKVVGVPTKELNAGEYVRDMRLLLNPYYSTDYLLSFSYLQNKEIREQLLLNGSSLIQYDDGTFKIQDTYYNTYTVLPGIFGFPKEVSFIDILEIWGSLRRIDSYQISSPFMFSFIVRRLSDKEIGKLKATGDIVLKQQLPDAVTKLKERKEDFYLLLQASVEEKEPIWSGFLAMTLWHKDRDELEQNGETFLKIASNQGYRFIKEEIPLPFFLAQLPLNTMKEHFDGRLGRNQVFLARNCPHLVPVSADWKGTETPTVPLVSRRGQPMFIHLWDTDGGSNYAAVAPMGSGKSFFSNHLLYNYATLPNSLIRVIDIGDSYWGLCQLLGGHYEAFKVGKTCLNPFYYIDPSLKGEGFETQLAFLVNLIGTLGRWNTSITDEEKGLINQALLVAIERWGNGFDLNDVIDIMRELAKERKNDKLVEFADLAFTSWLPGGQYGTLFNGKPTLNFDNRFTVLELGDARDDYHLLAVVLVSYLFNATREVMRLPRDIYKILHIDEAWRVLQIKHLMVLDAIEQGIREYRKFGGALGIVTQSIKDLFPTTNDIFAEKLKALRTNIDWLFIFNQNPEEWERMTEDKEISLSDFELELAKTIKTEAGRYSEMFIITRTRGRGIARVVVPPEFRWLYTTNPKEVQIRNDIYKETGDLKKTIEILTEWEKTGKLRELF